MLIYDRDEHTSRFQEVDRVDNSTWKPLISSKNEIIAFPHSTGIDILPVKKPEVEKYMKIGKTIHVLILNSRLSWVSYLYS